MIYSINEVLAMKTIDGVARTKAFMSGRSQAVRIPKEFRFSNDDLYVNKVGDSLIITPVSSLKDTFMRSLSMFTDDFMADGRPEELPNERIEL